MRLTTAGARTGEGVVVAGLGLGLGVVLAGGIAAVGPLVAVLPVAAVACWWLYRHPLANLALLFATTVCFEESAEVWPLAADRWYAAFGGVLHAPDVLVAILVARVLVDARTSKEPGPGLGPFTLPLILLAIATIGGLVAGYVGGGDGAVIYNSARVLVYLLVVPYVTAAILARRGAINQAVVFAVVVVTARAMVGLVGWFTHGRGSGADEGLTGIYATLDDGSVSFYEPTMNFLMVLVLLGLTAAVVVRHRLPRWLLVVGPLVAVTLAVSYRRSFWIAAVLGLILVLMVSTGRRGRPWLVFGGAAVALALYAAMFAGGATDTTNPVIYRAQSLTPSKLVTTSGDRYRLDEQRNVIAEIKANAATGLGLGVPWQARFPLAENPPGGRLYTHVTPLWFWLRLGPFGFLAYCWMMATAILVGYRVWQRARDVTVRVTGLALSAGFVALIVAELTGPFTGIDVRMTLIDACAFGWLIAAWAMSKPAATEDEGSARAETSPGTRPALTAVPSR